MRTKVIMMIRARVDAAQLGRFGVAADRVDIPTEATPRGEDRHDHRHPDRDEDRVGDAGRDLQSAFRPGMPFSAAY